MELEEERAGSELRRVHADGEKPPAETEVLERQAEVRSVDWFPALCILIHNNK